MKSQDHAKGQETQFDDRDAKDRFVSKMHFLHQKYRAGFLKILIDCGSIILNKLPYIKGEQKWTKGLTTGKRQ